MGRRTGVARFKLSIEYAGTRYRGWQVQSNARTVQGELLRALRELASDQPLELYGSGRTDAGVHALLQVAHLQLDTRLAPEALQLALNDRLPPDITVLAVEPVPHRFHARHGAVARSYLYQIARRRTAFAKPYVWWIKDPLDVEAMRKAAGLFVGQADFRAFSAADPEEKSTVVKVERVEVGEQDDLVLVRIQGSHFIWKMVRRVVGVLAEVGQGRLALGEVAGLLHAPSDLPARLTAPPNGLFLERVFYEGDSRELPLLAAVPVCSPGAPGATPPGRRPPGSL
jgi:tRNA pseudouridine38-40 synthase